MEPVSFDLLEVDHGDQFIGSCVARCFLPVVWFAFQTLNLSSPKNKLVPKGQLATNCVVHS